MNGSWYFHFCFSTETSADNRDISENAALSRSRSASRPSARDFIYSTVRPCKDRPWACTYRSYGIASCDQLMMVVVNQRLPLAVKLSYF